MATERNWVRGKVLTRETHEPVSDVLVVVYDYDGEIPEQLQRIEETVLAAGFPAKPIPVTAFNKLSEFWASIEADRIGSVLTKADGTFELDYADDLFQQEVGKEQRPDLFLLVMAPESSFGIMSLPPASRILHYSYAVRAGAGRTESYILHLSKALLDSWRLPYGRNPAQASRSVGPRLSTDNRLLADFVTNETVGAHITGIRALRQRALSFASKLATKPLEGSARIYLRPGMLLDQMSALVEGALSKVAARSTPVPVWLNERQLRAVGIDSATADANGRIAIADVRTVLDLNTGRHTRDRTLLDLCLDEVAADREPADEGEKETEPITVELLRAKIRKSLSCQLDAFCRDHDRKVRQDALGLRTSLESVRLASGPADVTAYHHFRSLQIALRHVWREVYDGHLREDAESLYEDWVKVRKYLGQPPPETDAEDELRDIRDFLKKVNADLSAAAGLAEDTDTVPTSTGVPRARVDRRSGETERDGMDAGDVAMAVLTGGASLLFQGTGRPRRRRTSVVRVQPPPTAAARAIPGPREPLLNRMERIVTEMAQRLAEPYSFDVFAEGSYNFGVLTTYLQRWEPKLYQVGNLVATIPLAPGEKRTFATRRVVRRSRTQKELERALSAHSTEDSTKGRADAEIVRKASNSTNFSQTVEVSGSFGDMIEIGATTEFGANQAQESSDTKKSFRESVRTAAAQYQRERSIEVTTVDERTAEDATTTELSNPNNEITVTYLFYELQRRYRVSEQLHEVTPVILIAADMPAPHEIDEEFLLTHEWVLRRVLLDDRFRASFDYLSQGLVGDELGVEILRTTWERNLAVVEKLSTQLDARAQTRQAVRKQVLDLIGRVARNDTERDVAMAIMSGGVSMLFGGGAAEGERLEAAREAANRQLEFADSDFAELEGRHKQAMSALESSTEKLVAAVRAQFNHRTAVDQLRIHVKQNIFYYMQAIWSHEPADQRFFRLYDRKVSWVNTTTTSATAIRVDPTSGVFRPPAQRFGVKLEDLYQVQISPSSVQRTVERRLAEVADLDRLIGFKGNYMIFPLRVSNPLVAHMMAAYRPDSTFGVLDPDDFGNYTIDELEGVVACLVRRSAPESEIEPIRDLIRQRRGQPSLDAEDIIVPTGQLFIEALPGSHPVIEDFKLLHRALDVKKAEAEAGLAGAELLRRTARLVEGRLAEFDIDKLITVRGATNVDVET